MNGFVLKGSRNTEIIIILLAATSLLSPSRDSPIPPYRHPNNYSIKLPRSQSKQAFQAKLGTWQSWGPVGTEERRLKIRWTGNGAGGGNGRTGGRCGWWTGEQVKSGPRWGLGSARNWEGSLSSGANGLWEPYIFPLWDTMFYVVRMIHMILIL